MPPEISGNSPPPLGVGPQLPGAPVAKPAPAAPTSNVHLLHAKALTGLVDEADDLFDTIIAQKPPPASNPPTPKAKAGGVDPPLQARTNDAAAPVLRPPSPEPQSILAKAEASYEFETQLPPYTHIPHHHRTNKSNADVLGCLNGTKASQQAVEADFARWRTLNVVGSGVNYRYDRANAEENRSEEVYSKLGKLMGDEEGNPSTRVASRLIGQSIAAPLANHVTDLYMDRNDTTKRVRPDPKYNQMTLRVEGDKVKASLTQLYSLQKAVYDKDGDIIGHETVGFIPARIEVEIPIAKLKHPQTLTQADFSVVEHYGSYCGSEAQGAFVLNRWTNPDNPIFS